METWTATFYKKRWRLTGTFLNTVPINSSVGHAVGPGHPGIDVLHEKRGLQGVLLTIRVSCAAGSPGGVVLSHFFCGCSGSVDHPFTSNWLVDEVLGDAVDEDRSD